MGNTGKREREGEISEKTDIESQTFLNSPKLTSSKLIQSFSVN